MVKDSRGLELKENDLVIQNGAYYLYQVSKIDDFSSKIGINSMLGLYDSKMFSKLVPIIRSDISHDYSKLADAIIKLINSQPRSPRKEEIVAALQGANNVQSTGQKLNKLNP